MPFVAFEGIDGSGKTSVAREYARVMSLTGRDVIYREKRDANFHSEFATRQMTSIKAALWDYPPEADILELGDDHWLFLMASWFSAIDALEVKPSASTDRLMVVDNWYYKFAARFHMKPGYDQMRVQYAFSGLSQPALTVFLQVDPVVAAARKKGVFLPSECGVLESGAPATEAAFIEYQTAVQDVLLREVRRHPFLVIDVGDHAPEQLARQAAERSPSSRVE